jgi:hypothetical protein
LICDIGFDDAYGKWYVAAYDGTAMFRTWHENEASARMQSSVEFVMGKLAAILNIG